MLHTIYSLADPLVVAKACFALEADHKWCLSGIYVQDRLTEETFMRYFC